MNQALIEPREEYLLSYLEACREYKTSGTGIQSINDPDTFEEWRHTLFKKYENQRLGINLPEGFVPASTFWLVGDGEYIGTGSLRHRLTPALERFGGHIGYAIRPAMWNKGYGTLQLKLLLREARALGIERALITCNDDNYGSARVIEKNGGVLENKVENIVEGKPLLTRRYWIDILE